MKMRKGTPCERGIMPRGKSENGVREAADPSPEEKRTAEEAEAPESGAASANCPARNSETFSGGDFHRLGLAETVADHLTGRMGFSAPTHIQQEAIPIILSGKDVLVNSETGTGKTVVYLGPIVNALQGLKKPISRTDGTCGRVYARALSNVLWVRVFSVAEKLVHRFIWLVPGVLTGGCSRPKEKARLRKGITILIATPGRLLDHLKNTASFKLDNLRWIVLDEADRLLDMGFERDVRSILTLMGSRQSESNLGAGGNVFSRQGDHTRQHILLSATLNEHVNQLVELSLNEPVTVGTQTRDMISRYEFQKTSTSTNKHYDVQEDNDGQASNETEKYNIPSQLSQSFYKVPSKLRLVALLALLQQKSKGCTKGKLVVFLSTCDAVDFHYMLIQEFNLPPGPNAKNSTNGSFLECKVFCLHGNMLQKDRMETVVQFGKASTAVLVCTDVASRGLDFKGVTCIVQYDPPGDAAEYVHRVGRTARLGEEGEAILFLQPCEMDYVHLLHKHGVMLKDLPLAKLLDFLPTDRKRKQSEDFTALDSHPVASYMHFALETFVSKKDRNALAAKAFGSYIRAYAAHKASLKPIFQVHKLHLGHVAKSFGLNTPPSGLVKVGIKTQEVGGPRPQRSKNVTADGSVKRRRLHAATMQE